MLDRDHMSATALSVTPPRATVAPILIAFPVAVLCATAGGLAWPVETEWGDWAGMAALVGPTLAVASLLAAMVRLVVLDWRAEIRSRAEWAALAFEPTTTLPEDGDRGGHLYQPAVCDEAVQAVLRAHRHVVPRHVVEPLAEIGKSHGDETGLSQSTDARQSFAAVSTGHTTPTLLNSSEISGGEFAEALDPSTICANAKVTRGGLRVVHSLAPVASRSRSKPQVHCGMRFATRVRRIVSAGAGNTWSRSGSRLRVMGVPIKIISDIVVVGQGENGPSGDGKPALGAELNGATFGAGPSRSMRSTVPSRTRLRRNEDTSTDLAAFTEAWQQVIALAEALARQAAREDDAAEHLQERSRSPPEMEAEELPSKGAKDDTS